MATKSGMLIKKIGKQNYYYESHQNIEPVAKAKKDPKEKSIEESRLISKATEKKNETNVHVKALEILNKSGLFHKECS